MHTLPPPPQLSWLKMSTIRWFTLYEEGAGRRGFTENSEISGYGLRYTLLRGIQIDKQLKFLDPFFPSHESFLPSVQEKSTSFGRLVPGQVRLPKGKSERG